MPETRQFCTFKLDSHLLGVAVEQVQEVMRAQELTPVPLAATAVRGLINLRGQIVLAVDLRACLGVAASPESSTQMNVVVRAGERLVSLVVDEIADVLDLAPAAFERPPSTVEGVGRALFSGVYKLERGLLLILDVNQAAAQAAATVDQTERTMETVQ
jgi:purine-binding chemotaxis protein CheW